MMKKLLTLLLLAFFTVALAACSGNGDPKEGNAPPEKAGEKKPAAPKKKLVDKYGWPVDANGNSVRPPFTHAGLTWLACWDKGGGSMGVMGKIGANFRWNCDLTITNINMLKKAIETTWGQQSIPAFRRMQNPGGPAAGPKSIPANLAKGGTLNSWQIKTFPKAGTGRIQINIANFSLMYDEQGANYLLRWLEEQYSACCL